MAALKTQHLFALRYQEIPMVLALEIPSIVDEREELVRV